MIHYDLNRSNSIDFAYTKHIQNKIFAMFYDIFYDLSQIIINW